MTAVLTELELLSALEERKSAYAFDPRPVEPDVIHRLFKAARLAPSSFNEQPWRFWAGSDENPDFRERLRDLLFEGNRWAKAAPVLILSGAHTTLERNGHPNRFASHDTGMATMALMLQAQHLGLVSHPMGGYDLDAAREFIGNPDIEPQAMIALGYPGDVEALEANLRERAQTVKTRRPTEEFVVTR
jgi:nitroreductase